MAAKPATSHVGDHQIAAITAGIRIAAVATRTCVPETIQIFLISNVLTGSQDEPTLFKKYSDCSE
jgi:hypothetical protein